MSEKQADMLKELTERISALTNDWALYWNAYSNLGTWQFWVNLALFALPLVILLVCLDRTKVFELGFYGFAAHLIATHADLYGTTHRLWAYPYKLFPLPPVSIGLDAALIPAVYMLFYQWTLNRRRNYYLYLLVVAAVFSFVFKPLLTWAGLFQLYEGSYLLLFGFYYIGGLMAKWITDLFRLLQHTRSAA